MIVYAPLEHIEQRYTTHLDRDILNYLDNNKIDYHYLEPKTLTKGIKNGSFLDSDNTVYRQFYQFNKLIRLLLNNKLPKDVTLFSTDIWNFSLLAVPYLNYFSNYNIKIKGVLHAGSFTDTDFVRQMERTYKGFEEILFDITDKIFVASNFIAQDVVQKRFVNPDKIIVSGLPIDEKGLDIKPVKKENIIVFNGRNVDEKQPYLFDLLKERLPDYKYVNTQKMNLNKTDYYNLLNKSKVVVSFALQENFGYGIQEAVRLGCIPILPNRLVYKEQFNNDYLYNNFDDCVRMVYNAMNDKITQTKVNLNSNKEIFKIWFND